MAIDGLLVVDGLGNNLVAISKCFFCKSSHISVMSAKLLLPQVLSCLVHTVVVQES